MITLDDVKEVSGKLALENGITADASKDDICSIIYRADVFDVEDPSMIERHIDIEYSFGEYYEIAEDTPLFQFICGLCDLPLSREEQEIVIWEK